MNVAGCSLRGLAMEEARAVLRGCQGEVDLILGNNNISGTYITEILLLTRINLPVFVFV